MQTKTNTKHHLQAHGKRLGRLLFPTWSLASFFLTKQCKDNNQVAKNVLRGRLSTNWKQKSALEENFIVRDRHRVRPGTKCHQRRLQYVCSLCFVLVFVFFC